MSKIIHWIKSGKSDIFQNMRSPKNQEFHELNGQTLIKWKNVHHSEIFAEHKGKRLCYGHSQEGQHTGLRASGPIQI